MSNLTVVIAAYNAEPIVAGAVRSAIASRADRIIVIDDGSNDATADAARSAGAEVVRQENAGAAAARRRGLAMVNSSYVVFLDADDALLEEGVQASLRLLQGSDSVGAVFGRTLGVRADGSEVLFSARVGQVTTLELLRLGYSPTPPAAIVWRTIVARGAMQADPVALWPRYAEDYELLVRGSLRAPIRSHEDLACRYALEGGKSAKSAIKSVECSIAIQRHYSALVGFRAPVRSAASIVTQVELRALRVNARSRFATLIALFRAFLRSPFYMARLQSARFRRPR